MEYCLINLEYQNLDVQFVQPGRQDLFKSHFGVTYLKVFLLTLKNQNG